MLNWEMMYLMHTVLLYHIVVVWLLLLHVVLLFLGDGVKKGTYVTYGALALCYGVMPVIYVLMGGRVDQMAVFVILSACGLLAMNQCADPMMAMFVTVLQICWVAQCINMGFHALLATFLLVIMVHNVMASLLIYYQQKQLALGVMPSGWLPCLSSVRTALTFGVWWALLLTLSVVLNGLWLGVGHSFVSMILLIAVGLLVLVMESLSGFGNTTLTSQKRLGLVVVLVSFSGMVGWMAHG